MRRLLVVLAVVLAACASTEGDTFGGWVNVDTDTWYNDVEIPDGRTIPCLVWSSRISDKGGMSCDWNAR